MRLRAIALPLLVGVSLFGLVGSAAADLPPANSDAASAPVNPRIVKLLRDADAAIAAGDLKLALVSLKEAVLLGPRNGDLRTRLGIMMLRTGDPVAAERELRQARSYGAPDERVVPPLLQAMVTRGENNELLAEFPDALTKNGSLAADILRARANALQHLGHIAEADNAMDRSLALRRDAHGLATRAQLAVLQNDLTLGLRLANEASKLAPDDEDTLLISVLLWRQEGDAQKALRTVSDFIARNPKSILARSLRADILLALNQIAQMKTDADWIVAQNSDLPIGAYYEALFTARTKGAKAGWREASVLPPQFVQSTPGIALTVARLAIAADATESATAILAATVERHPEVAQARIELAVLRLSQNSPDLALKSLEPLLNNDNPGLQAIVAQIYLRLQRFGDAIAALQKATSNPGGIEREDFLKRQMAFAEIQLGGADTAISELQQLAVHDPSNLDTALQLANTLATAGQIKRALTEIDRIAKAQPQNPLPPYYRGQILASDGKLAAASAAFSEAAAIDPKFIPAFYSRANAAVARGSTNEAVKDLDYIIARDHTNVPAYLLQAQIAFNNGRDDEAVSILRAAIKTAPNDPSPRLALARYQIGQRKFSDAQASLSDLLRASPDNANAIALQGDILFATGAKTEGVEKVRTLLAKYPYSPDVQMAWAKALNRINDQIGSESAAAKAVDLAPTVPQYRSDLIALQIAHGKTVDALLTARAYSDLHPGPVADLIVSGTLILLRRDEEAAALLEKSFARNPNPNLAFALSQIQLRLDKRKRAAEVLALAVQKNPDDFMLRRQYAIVLMETGEPTAARREFEGLLKQRPEDAVVLNRLARLVQKEDMSHAISLASLAVKIAPLSAAMVDNLGWIKFQSHDVPAALPLLQRAHALESSDPEITYHYAVALDAAGKRNDAKSLLQAILAKTPKFDDAKNAQQLLARW